MTIKTEPTDQKCAHTKRISRRWLALAFIVPGSIALAAVLFIRSAVHAKPLDGHCGRPGPLPIVTDYCGCTWGQVLFRGQPVAGARVTLEFGSGVITSLITSTQVGLAPGGPYFTFEGYDYGLRRNNIATVTAEYNGQTVSRTFRSRPDDTDNEGEQEINLVIPDVGEWLPEPSAGYTLALKIIGNEVWMGGTAGLIRRELTANTVFTENTGLSSGVAALATDASGRVWALGITAQAAVRDGANWQALNTNLTGTQRALALASDGSLWAGGDSGLSRFDGTSWQAQPDFNGALPNQVMGLHTAADGSLWAAVWDGGVAQRQSNGTWLTYTVANSGLNSDRVGGLSETSAGLWFALDDYEVPPRQFGGLSFYSPTLNAWQTYTQVHGLPLRDTRSVAGAPDGTVWVTTLGGGVAHSIKNSNPLTFTVYAPVHGLRSATTSRIAVSGTHVFVATLNGVDRFEPTALGAPPVATIGQVSPISATTDTELYLAATGSDSDLDDRIVGYEWTSDLDGPVCSLITCTVSAPTSLLRAGAHTLSLRVLDDEGMWSSAVTRTLTVTMPVVPVTPTPTSTTASTATPTTTHAPTHTPLPGALPFRAFLPITIKQ
jgi:hypothetical protein